MASLNKVLLMGNLTRKPESREVGDGNDRTMVCAFGLAMNHRFTGRDGQQREEACFVDIEVWGRQAENCMRYLDKGRLVLVEGRLQFDKWEDRETGAARSRLRVRANNVQFLDSPGGARGSGAGEGQGDFSGRGQNQRPVDPRRDEFSDSSQSEAGLEPSSDDDASGQGDDIPF